LRAALRLSGADLVELAEPGGPEEIERALARAGYGDSSARRSDAADGSG
jgi:hypothetical protein